MSPNCDSYISYKTIYRTDQGSLVAKGSERLIPTSYLCGLNYGRSGVELGKGYTNNSRSPTMTHY